MNSKSKKQMDAIVKDFSQAEAWLIALVGKVLATSDLSSLRARRRASRDTAKILKQLKELTKPRIVAFMRTSYVAGREASKAPNKSLGKSDQIALQMLVENLGGRLDDSITIVGRRVDDIFRREGLRATALAISGPGVINEDSIKRFRQRLIDEGITSFTDVRGSRWRLETYSSMALKTTMMEAVNAGAENLIRERGFDIIEIGHLGVYQPDSTCDPHHGKKYSLFGRTERLPLFGPTDRPPYHPNCEHFIRLAPEAAAERRRALRAA